MYLKLYFTICILLIQSSNQKISCGGIGSLKFKLVKLFQKKNWQEVENELDNNKQGASTGNDNFMIFNLYNRNILVKFEDPSVSTLKVIEQAYSFSTDFIDNTELQFVKVIDCAYDEENNLYLLFDDFYEFNHENSDYKQFIRQMKRQGLNMHKNYFNILETLNQMADYGITQNNFKSMAYKIDSLGYINLYVNPFFDSNKIPIFINKADINHKILYPNQIINRINTFYAQSFFMILNESIFYQIDQKELQKAYQSLISIEEKKQAIQDILIKNISQIYENGKPNIFKRFINYFQSFFSNDVSTIYDFPKFIQHILSSKQSQRKNYQFIVNTFQNCFEYSKLKQQSNQVEQINNQKKKIIV